jgi:hypothetical protein
MGEESFAIESPASIAGDCFAMRLHMFALDGRRPRRSPCLLCMLAIVQDLMLMLHASLELESLPLIVSRKMALLD